jgi:hypothetical protein
MKHIHFDGRLFDQGAIQRELGEVVASTSMVVSTLLCSH